MKAEALKTAGKTPALQSVADAEPRVKVKLFKDNSKYKSDVFVSVNGRSYLIRRGEEVEVPAEVAEVLEHSAAQDELTARRVEAAEQAAAQTEPTI